MNSPYDVLLSPVLTEKTYAMIADKRYTFLVDPNANKIEIRQAVEEAFGVKVASVNTVRRIGKIKTQGRTSGRRPETKRAYVTLTKASKAIDAFEGMA